MDRSPGPLPYPGSVNDGAARVWCERYELIDLVARVGPSSLWRAYDNRLRRTVGDHGGQYRYEDDVEQFFRHSPAVVRNSPGQ